MNFIELIKIENFIGNHLFIYLFIYMWKIKTNQCEILLE